MASVAGVSRGTVSRFLNGGERVSPEAMDAVARAIAETGYTANHAARTLALGRSNTVAFLLSEPQHILFEDPTFARLMSGCTRALAEHGILLTLVTAGTPADRERAVGYVSARHVDGVLLVSSHASTRWPRSSWPPGYRRWCAGGSPAWSRGSAWSAPTTSTVAGR